jgi:2-desacetyl-2-hydroxyethyl bacteriochlorophyllide A dehydrogenase
MKAAQFYGGADIRVAEVPTPEPGPGEVLVRVRAAGICGSDLHGYRQRRQGQAAPVTPTLKGHELAGEVAAMGDGVADLQIGDRVAVEPRHLVGCGVCAYCRRGDYHVCARRGMTPAGIRLGSTGFAEYSLEPAHNLYRLPDSIAMEEATLLDAYACGLHALRLAPATPLSIVVVQGAGAIGLTALEIYRLAGARRVIVCGTHDRQLELAKTLGADAVINGAKADAVQAVRDLTEGQGAEVVIEAVGGTAATFAPGIEMCARMGTFVILGMYSGPLTFAVREAHAKEIKIQFSNSYALWNGVPEFKACLDLLEAGRLQAGAYITHTFPLDRILDGFEAASNKAESGAVKVVILP